MYTRTCFTATALTILCFGAPILAMPCDAPPSWIFNRGPYTHDPATGARVAQYMRGPAVEPLDDPRLVTSRYRTSRTTLRGIDGSNDTTYEVQSWGNDRGGIDAQWERFHDAWLDSSLQGGYYNLNTPTPFPNQIYGNPPANFGGFPPNGFWPYGNPHWNGQWQNGYQQQGPWQQNNGYHGNGHQHGGHGGRGGN